MTAVDVARCGFPVVRCCGCGKTVGSHYDDKPCPCGSTEREPGGCRNLPMKGTTVCHEHGGKAPQVRTRAARRELDAEAREELRRLGRPDPIGPWDEEFAGLAAEFKARNDFYRRRLAELDSLTVEDNFRVERMRALHSASRDAARDYLQVLEVMKRLGLEEARARVDQAEVELLAQAVEVTLADCVPAELHREARQRLAQVLRALDSGEPIPVYRRALPAVSVAMPSESPAAPPVVPVVASEEPGMGADSPEPDGDGGEAVTVSGSSDAPVDRSGDSLSSSGPSVAAPAAPRGRPAARNPNVGPAPAAGIVGRVL